MLIGLLTVVVLGCSPQESEVAPGTVSQGAQLSESAEQVLAAYEGLRSHLANDQDVPPAEFERLAAAARPAAASYSGAAAVHLEQLAKAADEGGRESLDLAGARGAFGEVSRHVELLLADQPELAKGRYVFECPMATGYRKWVQQSDRVSNPYMGQAMLACGSPSKWQR